MVKRQARRLEPWIEATHAVAPSQGKSKIIRRATPREATRAGPTQSTVNFNASSNLSYRSSRVVSVARPTSTCNLEQGRAIARRGTGREEQVLLAPSLFRDLIRSFLHIHTVFILNRPSYRLDNSAKNEIHTKASVYAQKNGIKL